jgi:hypothetical protein
MWTVRQAPSQRDTPMLSGRTLHDRSRVRWLDQNRDPAPDRAWRWGVALNRDPARDRAWARGVAQNRDPARDRAWARGVSHNRNPARATRIAEISTLRLYCPLLNNNAPLPVAPEDNKSRPGVNWPAFVPVSCSKGMVPNRTQDPGIAALIVARLFQTSSEAAVPSSRGGGFLCPHAAGSCHCGSAAAVGGDDAIWRASRSRCRGRMWGWNERRSP